MISMIFKQVREKKREAFIWKAVDLNAKSIIIENKENKKDENVKAVNSNQRSFKVISFFLSKSGFLSYLL
jgi:hypothetical protein